MFPVRNDLNAYRGATFAFTLSFQNEDGTPWDLTKYQDIRVHFFTPNKQDTPEVILDELTISAGDVSGTLSSAQTKYFFNRVSYYEAIFTKADGNYYKANGVFSVWNVGPRPELNNTATIQADQPI